MTDQPQQQSNATNGQANGGKTIISTTTCIHGTSSNMQFVRLPSDSEAAALKAISFQNHQRLLPACNCTLT